MIQGLPILTTETDVKVSSLTNQLTDNESEGLAQDFLQELALSMNPQVEVAPIEISPEQLLKTPSILLENVEGQTKLESIGPKVFDPKLTHDVELFNAPKTSEASLTDSDVIKLAQGKSLEVHAKVGRAPAIDFAKAEIDPQLLDFEDFVVQKNLAKKVPDVESYGMKSKDLKEIQVVQGTEGAALGDSVSSQQFILNLMSESQRVEAPTKVLDLSHIKTQDVQEILNQVSDYIVQVKAAKEPTVNMRVNHEELGAIDITVSRALEHGKAETFAINIGTHSTDGKNFFQQNSKDLLAHLTSTGLNVTEFKVETSSQNQDFDFNQDRRQGQSSDRQFGSEQNQRRHESQRREELWKLFKDKEVA